MMRRALLLLLTLTLLSGHQSPDASAANRGFQPGSAGNTIRRDMSAAEIALTNGDVDGATSLVSALDDEFAGFETAFASHPETAKALRTANADVRSALSAKDPVAFAVANATVWTTLIRGSHAQVIDAASKGDAATASTWILLREFRPTTKFSRPSANATIAIRDLKAGKLSPSDAVLAINADLLDTYQASLRLNLETLHRAGGTSPVVRARTASLARGYWSIVAPQYAKQVGPQDAKTAASSMDTLVAAAAKGDAAAVKRTSGSLLVIERTFRAAPLSESEQQRRGGQLVRYLSLVPVEYGRGVHDGKVTVDIEIAEAEAFLEGAEASYADMYLFVKQRNPETAEAVRAELDWLRNAITTAKTEGRSVDESELKQHADRAIELLNGIFPAEWTRSGGQADFDVIDSLLDQMETSVKQGDYTSAESARLEAYAIYDMGAEKRLAAFAPQVANDTEAVFWGGNGTTNGLASAIASHASPAEIAAIRAELDRLLDEGLRLVGSEKPAEGVVIFNAATIVFREGLEGVLILASLVAAMIGGNKRFKKPLIIGALSALVATALLFWAAQTLLHSLAQYGEKLEAIVSLIAIGVLLIIMNWFFHKVYWTKWIGKHHEKRRMLVGGVAGQSLGLMTLGFTSVFREGAETVLFLQALTFDAGPWVVIKGTMLGLLGTAIVGVLVLMLQKKLPHKKMLIVTGLMIAFVLVVMVGTTTHVLQAVGWMPITPIEGLVVPYWMTMWFGINATWQGVGLQVLAFVVVIGSYYAAEMSAGKMELPWRRRPVQPLVGQGV